MTEDLQSLLTQLESTGTHFCGWPAVQDQESCHAAGLLMQRAALAISQLLEPPVKEKKPNALKGRKIAPKYRSGDNVWTGRGIKPNWVKAAIAAGVDIETFRI